MSDHQDFLLNRINFDPVVFMGCSEKEVFLVVFFIATPLLLAGGVLGYLLWGNIPFGMLPGIFISSIGIYFSLFCIRSLKRDKEPGFLMQSLGDFLERKGVLRTPIIRRSGRWSLGRALK